MDIQYIQPGFKADPNAPGMDEVMQWLQMQSVGKKPPLKAPLRGMTPEQMKQMLMIQMLRGNGEFDPAQQGRSGGAPMPMEQMMPGGAYGR